MERELRERKVARRVVPLSSRSRAPLPRDRNSLGPTTRSSSSTSRRLLTKHNTAGIFILFHVFMLSWEKMALSPWVEISRINICDLVYWLFRGNTWRFSVGGPIDNCDKKYICSLLLYERESRPVFHPMHTARIELERTLSEFFYWLLMMLSRGQSQFFQIKVSSGTYTCGTHGKKKKNIETWIRGQSNVGIL